LAEAAEAQADTAADSSTPSADASAAGGDDTASVPPTPDGEAPAVRSALDVAAAPTASSAGTAPTAPPAAAPAASEPPSPFLRSLVDAMRGVAEEARDANLAELKTLVEKRVEQIGTRTQERAEDLRRRSELDIKGVGDWERGEIERIRTEAERKVEARRQQLEQQLGDQEQQTEREIAAMRSRLADHERELAAFFARLTQTDDPAEFVGVARLIPQAPSLDADAGTAVVPPSADPAPTETLTERLAQLGVGVGNEPSPAAPGNGTAAAGPRGDVTLTERLAELEAQPQSKDNQVASGAPAPSDAEATSAVVVTGLASFGAITSFKQALEKVEGIHGVTLSLGPSGEFVYCASHDAGFDLDAAIVALESGAASVEHEPDGTLRVTISRPR